jgi:tRNA(Ile)-lysidine synthase TilS/MesJ
MSNVNILLKDRLDKAHILIADNDEPLRVFLKRHYIPRDSVISYVNGKIVDDQTYFIKSGDKITLDMVRAYQLPEYCRTLRLWEDDGVETTKTDIPSVYTKNVLWFNDNGICDMKESQFDEASFVKYVDDMFVQGILEKKLIKDNDKIILALSGGRDSLALLYLLRRNKDRLPLHQLIGVTVADTAASSKDIEVAREAITSLGVEDYTVLPLDYVNETMKFRHGFGHAIEKILTTEGRGHSITLWHHVMRSCVERFARERGIYTISFGYHFEDLFTSLFRTYTLGTLLGESAPLKTWGKFTHTSPLWTITKKELTLYLKFVAPETHSKQGSPTDFDRGDHNRDINYFMVDLLSGLWPGLGFNMFESLERLNKNYSFTRPEYEECPNCGITYTHAYGKDTDIRKFPHVCSHCSHLMSIGEISPVTKVV